VRVALSTEGVVQAGGGGHAGGVQPGRVQQAYVGSALSAEGVVQAVRGAQAGRQLSGLAVDGRAQGQEGELQRVNGSRV